MGVHRQELVFVSFGSDSRSRSFQSHCCYRCFTGVSVGDSVCNWAKVWLCSGASCCPQVLFHKHTHTRTESTQLRASFSTFFSSSTPFFSALFLSLSSHHPPLVPLHLTNPGLDCLCVVPQLTSRALLVSYFVFIQMQWWCKPVEGWVKKFEDRPGFRSTPDVVIEEETETFRSFVISSIKVKK